MLKKIFNKIKELIRRPFEKKKRKKAAELTEALLASDGFIEVILKPHGTFIRGRIVDIGPGWMTVKSHKELYDVKFDEIEQLAIGGHNE